MQDRDDYELGETLSDEEMDRIADEIRAINEEEGRNHPDIRKAEWEANLPQYSESEIDW